MAHERDGEPTARGLDAQLASELHALDREARLRTLVPMHGRMGPRMRMGEREVWMFAGANYLDLAAHPSVVAAAQRALSEYGAAAGGARLISGNLPLHEALERELAAFMRCEATLLFSTGYMANLGVITALAGRDDLIVSDALNHASLIDACRLSGATVEVFAHGDPDDARRALTTRRARRRLLVTDGVYSMDGDVAPLAELAAVARSCDAQLVLDDTHGIGVLGEQGRGSSELAGAHAAVDIWIGNLGKAFGSFGAFVAGSHTLRAYLLNRARSFIFTCGLPPASVAAARAALAIAQREPARRTALLARAAQLRSGLTTLGYDVGQSSTHVVPVVVGDDRKALALAAALLERGFFAQAIRYPSVPSGSARLRLTAMSSHSAADVDALLAAFAELAPPSDCAHEPEPDGL
jgi:8-amino-7-oxononanoate synthase